MPTSVALGTHFEAFVRDQLESGRFLLVERSLESAGTLRQAASQTLRCLKKNSSHRPCREQLRAADLGGGLVERPQRLLASLRGQGNMQAIGKVRRALAVQLQRDFQGALGLEAEFGG